ncbi:MAG: BTAD domain-containing putative transcriptional regulator [Acidimicrobiales bacterium]
MHEYSVLGPLEVAGPDGALPITGRNERIVLAALVGWAGEVVSSDRLVEALWGEEPPRSGTKVVQNLVMRLRKVLGSEVIATRPGGYVLQAESDAIDVRRFDRLVAEGRAAAQDAAWEASATSLAAAMELWRGRPLVELDHWQQGQWEAARLEEQRRAVTEEHAEAELACGKHREALARLYNMVSEEPLREHRWALLMLALYRCGQHAEALRSYQRASALLGELGLTPGTELRALERAIGAGDLSIGPQTLGRLRVNDGVESSSAIDPTSGLTGGQGSRPGATAGNLPAQLTSFVGRDSDLSGVAAALLHSRVVTIIGAGGVGKTRLAIQVAKNVVDYADGAWFCELAAAASAGELADAVAAAIGARTRAGLTVEQSVVDRLRDTEILLVLDNCEHLVDGARRFAELLLQSCPRLRILATSRERLGASGEQIWPLGSLSVPDPSDLGAHGETEAVVLFADRAKSVKPSFTIGPANTAAVDEICRRLDGIPLAIELAAARVAVMTPTEIATHLDVRFRLLRGTSTPSDGRHSTLRATLDWSYSLLENVERRVFDRLGAFSGRFDAAAAAAVSSPLGIEAWDVLDALGELVGQSMVVTVDDAGDVTRYLLLETFRHYSLERLAETSEVADTRRAHAEHYAEVAEATGHALRGPDELAWRARFRADRDNLRAAVSWSLSSEVESDRTFGLRIIAALAHESMQEGEPIGVLAEAALVHADTAPAGVRTAVFASAAWFVHRRGDVDTARELCLEALRDGLPSGCPSPEMVYFVLALTAMADATRRAQIFDDAHRTLEQAHADDFAHGFLWSAELYMQLVAGDALNEAASREALRTARRIGNPSLLVRLLCNLAALSWLDNPEAARHQLEEAVALAEVGASAHMLGFGLAILARLRTRGGDFDGARDALRAAIIRGREDSDPFILATAVDRGIHVLEDLGRLEDAAVWAGAVVEGALSRTVHLPARERPLRTQAIDRLRLALGEDGYAAAASRGARMSDDELVRHGLGALAD